MMLVKILKRPSFIIPILRATFDDYWKIVLLIFLSELLDTEVMSVLAGNLVRTVEQ